MIKTAYKFMKFDMAKSIGIIVGIVISIFLIGQQLATLGFITSLMSAVISNSNSGSNDIWVVDHLTRNVNALSLLDRRILFEIRSIEGVETTFGIAEANATATFDDGKTASVKLIGSEGPVFIGGPKPTLVVAGHLDDLSKSTGISAEFFAEKSLETSLKVGQKLELNQKSAEIKLQTKNAQGYAGNLIYTSLDNVRFYAGFPSDKISIIVVRPAAGADPELLIDKINNTFGGVKAWKSQELRDVTISDLLISTNMGVSFGSLVGFAMISGFFIIGLTLYSSALDRLKDYGTLKAIGATNGFVTRLILVQAFLFAVVGFIISFLLLLLFKEGVANAGLILEYSWKLISILVVITFFMSIGGSLFAIRKIKRLEPASIF